MADNTIKVAAVGAAVYVAYTQGWLSFLGIGAAASSTAAATTGASAGAGANPPAAAAPAAPNPKANVLDGIYARMVTAANAPSQGLGIDQWGYYLNQQLAPLGLVAPDPEPIFTATPLIEALNAANPNGHFTFDRAKQVLSATDYWLYMAPALKSQLGLSGLGVIGGLGLYWRTA